MLLQVALHKSSDLPAYSRTVPGNPGLPGTLEEPGLRCSCPDWAVSCKHIAAVIYLVSREIDGNPFLVFSCPMAKKKSLDTISNPLFYLVALQGLEPRTRGL